MLSINKICSTVEFLWFCSIRYVEVIQLLFLIKPLHLIGVWFGEDKRTNTTINANVKRRLGYVFNTIDHFTLDHRTQLGGPM